MLSPPHRALLRGAVLSCLLVLLIAGCGSSSGSGDGTADPSSSGTTAPSTSGPTTTPARDPAPAPQVGACRRLTYGDISRFSNASATTSCKKPHTAFTFAVKELPSDVAFKGVDIGNDAVQEKAADLCRSAFAPYVGGSAAVRALSRLSVTYFVPSQQDFDLGARWVRCDVIALQSSRILAELPDQVQGFNTSDAALDAFGVCSQGEPGSSGAMLVMCDQDHDFRALAAFRLGAEGDDYPGETTTKTDGQQRCDDFISQTLGLGGGYSYAWTYPSAEDWSNGQRFGFCWNKTSS